MTQNVVESRRLASTSRKKKPMGNGTLNLHIENTLNLSFLVAKQMFDFSA